MPPGMEEGGVCLWDLREPADGHPEAEGVVRRRPTYTTEFACDFEDIVGSIAALAVSSSKPTSAASVEVRGSLKAWAPGAGGRTRRDGWIPRCARARVWPGLGWLCAELLG